MTFSLPTTLLSLLTTNVFSSSSSPNTSPAMTISCSVSTLLTCNFVCMVSSTSAQTVKITLNSTSNPISQQTNTMKVNLYYQSAPTTTICSEVAIQFSGPTPLTIDSSSSYGDGYTGQLNTAYICMKTSFAIPASSTITIGPYSSFPILDTSTFILYLNGATFSGSYSNSPTTSTQTLVVTINTAISQSSTSTLCVSASNIRSSSSFPSNNVTIVIANSGNIIAQAVPYATWTPKSVSILTGLSVSASDNKVGNTGVTYFFQFQSSFALSYILTFNIKVVNNICIQTENKVLINSLGLFQTCIQAGCECTFQLPTGISMAANYIYTLSWITFNNPLYTRPINFQMDVYAYSTSNKMATSSFSLTSLQPSTLTISAMNFYTSTSTQNKISQVVQYTLTINSATEVNPQLYLNFLFPSIFTLQSNPCSPNCIAQVNNLYIGSSDLRLTAGQDYTTIPIYLQNPSCGGSKTFSVTGLTYNYLSTDPTSNLYGYSASSGTGTFTIKYIGNSCNSQPTITSSSTVLGGPATYTAIFTGCSPSSTILTSAIISFPGAYGFSTVSCSQSCSSSYASVLCSMYDSQSVTIPLNSNCAYNVTISGVINPNLPGPTSPIVFSGIVGDCELYTNNFLSSIVITPNTNLNFSYTIIVPDSSVNLDTTIYTFKFQICTSCKILQSTLVNSTITIQWASSSEATCDCTSPVDTTPAVKYYSMTATSCTLSFEAPY